ncbi:hypothetical protein CW304_15175 [Bacillus sp. UFRGS-B20]|nr:hypothetical protein CW304_15175 [Bacillus sp. UFRGS-B20]
MFLQFPFRSLPSLLHIFFFLKGRIYPALLKFNYYNGSHSYSVKLFPFTFSYFLPKKRTCYK